MWTGGLSNGDAKTCPPGAHDTRRVSGPYQDLIFTHRRFSVRLTGRVTSTKNTASPDLPKDPFVETGEARRDSRAGTTLALSRP